VAQLYPRIRFMAESTIKSTQRERFNVSILLQRDAITNFGIPATLAVASFQSAHSGVAVAFSVVSCQATTVSHLTVGINTAFGESSHRTTLK
jgi:hypothetical protein